MSTSPSVTRTCVSSLIEKRRTACAVCASGDLAQVLDLPQFPLTGIYVARPAPDRYPNVDQALLLCGVCGHAQLLNTLDPAYLYVDTYSHRTSISPIARDGNDFFFEFALAVAGGRHFNLILEVGCNDLYLLRKMQALGRRLVGVDPIWKDIDPPTGGPVAVIPGFVETIDYRAALGDKPDLVISAHTFEHLDEPATELRRLMDAAADGAVFIVEVPAFDGLLARCRFDQVFHQHLHYFSVASFVRLIDECGGEYITHRINHGYWGGTLLAAFRKPPGRRATSQTCQHPVPQPPSCHQVGRQLQRFRHQLDGLTGAIDSLRDVRWYGYGGAQMVPTLAYHMGSDLAFLACIWDDNPARSGMTYPHLAVSIRLPDPGLTLEDAAVLVTAPDSLRPILCRLIALKARQIVVPLHTF